MASEDVQDGHVNIKVLENYKFLGCYNSNFAKLGEGGRPPPAPCSDAYGHEIQFLEVIAEYVRAIFFLNYHFGEQYADLDGSMMSASSIASTSTLMISLSVFIINVLFLISCPCFIDRCLEVLDVCILTWGGQRCLPEAYTVPATADSVLSMASDCMNFKYLEKSNNKEV